MKNKKLKYGSFAVGMTVAVLVVLILANGLLSAVAQRKNLYLDMTTEQIYSISDEADAIFSSLSQKPIEIIFFTEPDVMLGKEEQKMVYEYALKLQDRYDYITVKYIDSIENPELVEPYLSSEKPRVLTTEVVITNGSAFRCFALSKFFTKDSQTETYFAFDAEFRFASALMQLSYDSMLACFTVNHGEAASSDRMRDMFADAGFEVRDIDIMTEDIPEDTRVLIINSPTRDFAGADDDVNEIKKIDTYLDNMGNLMVFTDPSATTNLPNLNEFLTEWGIAFTPAQIEDKDNCIGDKAGLAVVAQYTAEGDGASLNKLLREEENPPKTVVANAMPVEILWTQHNGISVSPILETYETATAYSIADNKTVVTEGVMPLMTVSMKKTPGEDNGETYYNYVLCAGTKSFTDEKYLRGSTYGNGDIIYAAMRAFGKEMVPVDLDFKVFDDQTLTVELTEANVWTVTLTALMPSVVAVVGAVVLIRRKYL
ncbi:MAG: GldG family protein [Clostridia bacterium]|nr:GldG family protein [Clostridia bacterium]